MWDYPNICECIYDIVLANLKLIDVMMVEKKDIKV